MSQSAKTAIGGMITALSVVLLIPTALDLFVYALPAMAGVLTMFCVVELGRKWSVGVYAAASILSLLLVPNKEAAVLYIAFFGYYPIVKSVLESKLPRVLEYIVKFAVFNVSMICSYIVLNKVFGIPLEQLFDLESETGFWAKYTIPVLLAAGNVVFIVFDIGLTGMVTAYLKVWQKRFRKLFPFK